MSEMKFNQDSEFSKIGNAFLDFKESVESVVREGAVKSVNSDCNKQGGYASRCQKKRDAKMSIVIKAFFAFFISTPVLYASDIDLRVGDRFSFESNVIEEGVTDSYFVALMDINADGYLDVVRSGLGNPGQDLGQIIAHVNPFPEKNDENPLWKRTVLARISVPVGLATGDFNQDGNNDIAVSHDYGFCIFGCEADNGEVSWLENPGKSDTDKTWKRWYIGDLLATHRLRVGNFSGEDLQVAAFPVTGGIRGNISEGAKIKLFSKPLDLSTAPAWTYQYISLPYPLIHGESVIKEHNKPDSFLVAHGQGITYLSFDGNKWTAREISKGKVDPSTNNPLLKGTGDVDVGYLTTVDKTFIAAQEPFHGTEVVVYATDSDDSFETSTWNRFVIDTHGTPNKVGEGPIHHLLCADLDNDGSSEIIVSLRGPTPYSGVFVYYTDDLNIWRRQRISTASASRMALGDIDGDGKIDIVSVPYVVSTYYRADDPRVMVLYNRTLSQ